MTSEPKITINGKALNDAQAMTMRVALDSFYMTLNEGLGDDEHGREMTKLYKLRITEIQQKIFDSL